MKLRTAMVLSHACVVLSVGFLLYSFNNYLLISNVVLPNFAALSAQGVAVIEPKSVQGAWLSTIESYEAFARYQLIGWVTAWVLSVAAVIALHRSKSRAG